MDKMAIYVKQYSTILFLIDDMILEYLVIQGTRLWDGSGHIRDSTDMEGSWYVDNETSQ